MTFNNPSYSWKLHNHQVLILDEGGNVYESCDSIFNTTKLLNSSLLSHFSFLESEFDFILNSRTNKITFEKMQTEFGDLPGFYDFVFSKYESEGKQYVVWDIYDYTKIYKEYANIQQFQNELAIRKQYEIKKNQTSPSNAAASNEFFQSDYITNSKHELKHLLNDFARSKFDVLDFFENYGGALYSSEQDLDNLKAGADNLLKEINGFIERLKNTRNSNVYIRKFVNQTLSTNKSGVDTKGIDVNFNSNVEVKRLFDEILVAQLLRLLCYQGEIPSQPSSKKLFVECTESPLEGTHLCFSLKEFIASNEKFANSSKARFINLSILNSFISMLRGTLSCEFQENSTIFAVDLVIPVK